MKEISKSIDPLMISIPTLMREEQQIAIKTIPSKYHHLVRFFTREDRVETLRVVYPDITIVPIPMSVVGIAATRQYVLDHTPSDKVWMIDDRVKLHPKRDPETLKTTGWIDEASFDELYDLISDRLDKYVQVSVAPRFAVSQHPYPERENHRVHSVNALRTDVLRNIGVRFDDMYREDSEIMFYEDFYLTLSLLTRGYKNLMIYDWAFNQNHGEAGGNSVVRNSDNHNRSAVRLSEKFPRFVSLHTEPRKNQTAGWDGMRDRYDVHISWKKSYEKSIVEIPPETGNLLDFI